jgi:predicted metal-dependent hydrolase
MLKFTTKDRGVKTVARETAREIAREIEVAGITFHLVQKRIKNLHLRIHPLKISAAQNLISPQQTTQSEARISAPLRFSLEKIKKFIISNIDWIKAKQIEISKREIIAPMQFISGEKHFLWGKSFELRVLENAKKNGVLLNENFIELHLKKVSSLLQKTKIIDDFYRRQLAEVIPNFIAEYEKKMSVKVAEFRLKKMKTRWGTCNPKARRIWLSLELAKRQIECVEFIIVHEMTHLLERKHNRRFFALMDKFMPNWRLQDKVLKSTKMSIG